MNIEHMLTGDLRENLERRPFLIFYSYVHVNLFVIITIEHILVMLLMMRGNVE